MKLFKRVMVTLFMIAVLCLGSIAYAALDQTPPSKPKNLTASSVTYTSVKLQWGASTDDTGIDCYRIYRDSQYIGSTKSLSYVVKNLVPGKTYIFYVKARDLYRRLSCASNSVKVYTLTDRIAPSIPSGLTAQNVSTESVTLTWSKSTDNAAVKNYLIYKNGQKAASTSALKFTAAGLSQNTVYSFTVKAQDLSGNLSPASKTISVRTLKKDLPPSAPSDLSASLEGTSVTLFWSKATDDQAVACYRVYQDGVFLASLSGTSYTIEGLETGRSYSFYVKSKDTGGNLSTASLPVTVKTPAGVSDKILNGYYASWAAYKGYTPSQIPAGSLTHITYAFANINDNLKIELGDPDVDPNNFAELNALKQKYPYIKTLISVGGWSWSDKFSDVALTDASRRAFAQSTVDFIKKYGFDGVDIDWEYPTGGGMPSNATRPEDAQNFILLMKTLREALNELKNTNGREYLLSFAGGSGTYYASKIDLTKLADYVNFATVMTYDIHGSWDTYTDFNAPLYMPRESSPQYKWSVDSSLKLWSEKGFPVSKMLMGVPFYGIRFTGVLNGNDGLYQRFLGGGSLSYDTVVSTYLSNASYVLRYHGDAHVPWLFNGSTFITYDDEKSIAEKAKYVSSNDFAGAAVWELSNNKNGTLLGVLHDNMS